jgi:hypothetical protein
MHYIEIGSLVDVTIDITIFVVVMFYLSEKKIGVDAVFLCINFCD